MAAVAIAGSGLALRLVATGAAVVDGAAALARAAEDTVESPSAAGPDISLAAAFTREPDPLGDRSTIGAPLAPEVASLTSYRWPLQHARLTNAFGRARAGSFVKDGHTFHDGIDIASFCGDRIVAAHDGVVLAAGRHYDRFLGWVGNLQRYLDRLEAEHLWGTLAIAVVIDDGNGYRSIYVHFRKTVVKAGQVVRAGDLLGYEGSTGYSTGCHLHYGLFSPYETATIDADPKLVARIDLPAHVVARIDPLLVMPPMGKADIAWGWGAQDFR